LQSELSANCVSYGEKSDTSTALPRLRSGRGAELVRRVGIFPETDQQDTRYRQRYLVKDEDLRIGMEHVVRSSAQCRTATGAEIEQNEHQPINLAVGLQAE